MKLVIIILFSIFFITGCSLNPIDSSIIPIGNSTGAFQYNVTKSESIDDKFLSVDDGILYYEEPAGFDLTDDSTEDILLFSNQDNSISFSVTLIRLNEEIDTQIYKRNFEDKINEMYPSGSFSFNGDFSSIVINDLSWECYDCKVNENKVEGYFTFYDNNIIVIEFTGSYNESLISDFRDTIKICKETIE